jgi:HAD superfamily hydrolase (TIGR01509 family)
MYNSDIKIILVDAVDCFVSDKGEIFKEMQILLDSYSNKKIILTNAPDDMFEGFGLNRVPYEVFTLRKNPMKTDPKYFEVMLNHFNLKASDVVYFEHNPEAVESARKAGITSYLYDHIKRDLGTLKIFLNSNI